MNKGTIKILKHYAKLAHIGDKWVIKSYENLDDRKKEIYLFSVRASIKLMETARVNPELVADKQLFISEFIKKERALGRGLPDFKTVKLKDKHTVKKSKKMLTEAIKGQREYPIPTEWEAIDKLLINGRRVDFSVIQKEKLQVIRLDRVPKKDNQMTAWVYLKEIV